jgi:transcriptional regulator with XRE-family HTH domain
MSSLENRVDKRTGKQVGRDDGPAPATFAKLFKGERVEPKRATREAIARVLGVSLRWLDDGEGEPPKLTAPYREMPRDESLREHDPAEWAAKYAAIGGPAAMTSTNPFQRAVIGYGSTLETETIIRVAERARGHEHELTEIGWMRELAKEQAASTDATSAAKPKPKPKEPAEPPKKKEQQREAQAPHARRKVG